MKRSTLIVLIIIILIVVAGIDTVLTYKPTVTRSGQILSVYPAQSQEDSRTTIYVYFMQGGYSVYMTCEAWTVGETMQFQLNGFSNQDSPAYQFIGQMPAGCGGA